MKINIDMAKLTLGDMEDFESITGAPIQAMSKYQTLNEETGEMESDGLPTKFLTALILIGQRKVDPKFDVEAARALPIQELDLSIEDSLNPPNESD